MSKKQEDFRKRLLTKIHIHERYKEIKQAGFWEEWVALRYGVPSAKFLSITELKEVLDIFNAKKEDREYSTCDSVGRAKLSPLAHQKPQALSKKQALKIEHLFNILRYNDTQKKAFLKKQLNTKIDSILALNKEEATKIIIGLNNIIQWDSKRLRYANNADFKG